MRDHLTNRGRAAQYAATTFYIIGMLLATGSSSAAEDAHTRPDADGSCADDNGGITLPPGSAPPCSRTTLATPDISSSPRTGWSRQHLERPLLPQRHASAGGFWCPSRYTGDGRADVNIRFGETARKAAPAARHRALRQRLFGGGERSHRALTLCRKARSRLPGARGHRVGTALTGDHPMHPFAIDAQGGLYVNLGSAPTPARSKTACPTPRHPAVHGAGDTGRHLALRRQPDGQRFSPPSASSPGSATREASQSTLRAWDLCDQHGRDQLRENWLSSTRRSRAPMSRRRSCCGWSVALTMGGRSATSTPLSRNWSWPRSTVRRREGGRAVRAEARPCRIFPATGRLTTSCSTTEISSWRPTGEVRFIAFHGSWTGHRSPRRLQRGVSSAR